MRPELLQRVLSLLPKPSSKRHPELARFTRILREYPERGGKGIRSELLLLTAQAYGAKEEQWETALWLATGLELFQNWVLIHDDIEDDSDERRGKPTLHNLYGMPLALNAGDALHAYMWEAVLRSKQHAAFAEFFAEFVQMVHRTAEGQHLDLSWVQHKEWNLSENDYLQMIRLKTAYYTIIAPLRLGFVVTGHAPKERIEVAGLSLGTAFQLRDDILNLKGDPDKYGKEIAGDLFEGKRTLIVLHWLRSARTEQKQAFLTQMQRHRSEKDPEQIKEIHQWILESDSIDYAQAQADSFTERGLIFLAEVLSDAKNQETALDILRLMKKLASREA